MRAVRAPVRPPPLRLLHLDLAVLLAFSVSYAFFGAAELGVSVPSAYPLLGYLLVRMVDRRSTPARPAAPLLVGPGFLLLAIAFLAAFRVALNVVDGNVIDVGYASVIGADQLTGGGPLYGAFPPDNEHGDTYGPVDLRRLRAVRGAAAVGRELGRPAGRARRGDRLRPRLRGPAVAARPAAARRDARAAARLPVDDLPVHADGRQLGLQRRARRAAGAGRAARGLTAGRARRAGRARGPDEVRAARAGAAVRGVPAAAACSRPAPPSRRSLALALAPFDLSVLWDRTLGFQAGRDSPFSIWGLYELPGALQAAAQVGGGRVRRRRGLPARRTVRPRWPRWPPRC